MNLKLALQEIDLFYGPPLTAISNCLRGFLIPSPGSEFVTVDFASIEARVLAWLAGCMKVIEVFNTHGKIYEAAAAEIYRVSITEVTDDQRQIGKVSVLALGFGGGKGAFQLMAKAYKVKVSDKKSDEIKIAYRLAHPEIPQFWEALNTAAMRAVLNPGKVSTCTTKFCSISYKVAGSFLWCKLPSGGVLCYPYPKIMPVETPWGEMKDSITYMGEDQYTRKWTRLKTYGGKLTENVTQAVARDILAEAMLAAEDEGLEIVMHVHDEVICEVPKNKADESLKLLEGLMSRSPDWAKDLPIKAKGWHGKRYRK